MQIQESMKGGGGGVHCTSTHLGGLGCAAENIRDFFFHERASGAI